MSRCSARTSAGEPCRRYAMAGATVCPTHGGRAPQVRKAAHQRLAESRALRVLDREGVEPVTDPVDALARLAAEAVGLKDLLGQRVAELSDDGWVSRTKLGAEQASAWLSAYERAVERTGKLLVDLARLGLDERAVRLSEAQGRMIAQVLSAALDACGLSDRADVRAALADQLRLVASDHTLTTPGPTGRHSSREPVGPTTTWR